MLSEIHIEGLGVIDHATLLFGDGLVAITGETGAGKTMIVEAIDMLLGERFDATMLRHDCNEARIDGRFVLGDQEVVLSRVMPRTGRSRAYIDGRLATVSQLQEIGSTLVDLHGQNAHQSLLRMGAQRSALDSYGKVDLSDLRLARATITEIDAALATLGGDARTRARDIDLLRFQISEIESAGLVDVEEDRDLDAEEDLLAKATQYRESFSQAYALLSSDDGALDKVHSAISALGSGNAVDAIVLRLRSLAAEMDEVVVTLRHESEMVDENPQRLADVRQRRQLLRDLRRKYGESLADVVNYLADAQRRLDEMVGHDARVADLENSRAEAIVDLAKAQEKVLVARKKAAPRLAKEVERLLPGLALANARLEIEVRGEAGDEVEFRFSANPGMPMQPLSKIASGGEASRLMLALNLVLTTSPDTLVFDEVDAGIGGDAANTVADALAQLGVKRQVLVVTHLPQVAAVAKQQIHVSKTVSSDMTFAQAQTLKHDERVAEIARMLSGDAVGKIAVQHARELMNAAKSRIKNLAE